MFRVVHTIVNIVCILALIVVGVVMILDISYMMKNPVAKSISMLTIDIALLALAVVSAVVLVADLLRKRE